MVATGRVEIVAETYYHSLAFFYSLPEFERQVAKHREKIQQLFGVETRVFRNTELAYNDDLAKWADEYGFDGILAEGWDKVLDWRSPNYVYRPKSAQHTSLLLKNYRLSDDLAFRFGDKNWSQWPLKIDDYISWIEDSMSDAPLVNLFMVMRPSVNISGLDTGIFDFFAQLVDRWSGHPDRTFHTVSSAIAANPAVGELSMPDTVTWADSERDLTAWLGNDLQQESLRLLYELEDDVLEIG